MNFMDQKAENLAKAAAWAKRMSERFGIPSCHAISATLGAGDPNKITKWWDWGKCLMAWIDEADPKIDALTREIAELKQQLIELREAAQTSQSNHEA